MTMAFFTILLAIMVTCSYHCMTQDLTTTTQRPKCSRNDWETQFRFVFTYITLEKRGNDPTFNGTIKDKELNMCPVGTGAPARGPAVNNATLIACKTTPQICKLDDGRFFYYDYVKDCFRTYDSVKYPWGITETNDALGVYTSIGANDIDMGTTFVIKELINTTLPNATIPHNGCVRVDHICQSCPRCNDIALYIGTKNNSVSFPLKPWTRNVTVLNERCGILKYV